MDNSLIRLQLIMWPILIVFIVISVTAIEGTSSYNNNYNDNDNDNAPRVIELVGYSNRKARTHYKAPRQKYNPMGSSSAVSSAKIQADIETVKQNIEKYNKLLAVDTKNLPEFQKDMLQRIVERVARLKETLDINEKLTQVLNKTQYKASDETLTMDTKNQSENVKQSETMKDNNNDDVEAQLENITQLPYTIKEESVNDNNAADDDANEWLDKTEPSLNIDETTLLQLQTSMDTLAAVQAAVTSVQTQSHQSQDPSITNATTSTTATTRAGTTTTTTIITTNDMKNFDGMQQEQQNDQEVVRRNQDVAAAAAVDGDGDGDGIDALPTDRDNDNLHESYEPTIQVIRTTTTKLPTTIYESLEEFTDTTENDDDDDEYFVAARSNSNINSMAKNNNNKNKNNILAITAASDNDNNHDHHHHHHHHNNDDHDNDKLLMLSTPTTFSVSQQQQQQQQPQHQRTLTTSGNKMIMMTKMRTTKKSFHGSTRIAQMPSSTKRKPGTISMTPLSSSSPLSSPLSSSATLSNSMSPSFSNYTTTKMTAAAAAPATITTIKQHKVPQMTTAAATATASHKQQQQQQHHYQRITQQPFQQQQPQYNTQLTKTDATAVGAAAAALAGITSTASLPAAGAGVGTRSSLSPQLSSPSSFNTLTVNNVPKTSSSPSPSSSSSSSSLLSPIPSSAAPATLIGATAQMPIAPVIGTGYSSSTNSQSLLYDGQVNTSAIIDSLNTNAREGDHVIISTNNNNNIDKPTLNGAGVGGGKPTKYHYYPHNQHIYLLPECAIQQVCNAVYVRLNYTQPLCACPSRYRDPCSASLNEDDQHTTKLVGDSKKKAITLAKTCEATTEMRDCRSPKDWSLLALQNTRTGKSHYLVICRCPEHFKMDGPMAHDQNTYASVPGIRVFGMMCVKPGYSVRKPSAQPPKRYQMHKPYYRPGSQTSSMQYGRPSYNGGGVGGGGGIGSNSGSGALNSSPNNYHSIDHPSFTNSHTQSTYEYLNRPDNTMNTNFHNNYHRPDTISLNNFPTAGGYGRNNERNTNLPIEAEIEKPAKPDKMDKISKKNLANNDEQHPETLSEPQHQHQHQREKRSLIEDFETWPLPLDDADIPEFPWQRIREFERSQIWD